MRALLLLILIVITPSATALVTIVPNGPNYADTATFQQKNSESYFFSLPNPPFNYSAPYGANDSINTWAVKGQFVGTSVTQTTHYNFEYQFNSTEDWSIGFDAIKHGGAGFFLSITYWTEQFTIYHNGQFLCNDGLSINTPGGLDTTFNGLGINLVGNQLGGSKQFTPSASLSIFPYLGGNTNVTTGATNLSNMMIWSLSDGQHIFNGCRTPTGFPFILQSVQQLTAPLTLVMTTSDNNPYNHEISWQFLNVSASNQFLNAQGLNPGGSGATNQCISAGFFTQIANLITNPSVSTFICTLGSMAVNFFEFIFSLFNQVLTAFFQFIPGGQTLANAITFPLQLLQTLTVTTLTIYFQPGANYPAGGAYFAVFMWTVCMGLVLGSIAQQPQVAFRLPAIFIKVTLIGAIIFFYWIYIKIPTIVITFIVEAINDIPGA